MPDIEEAPKAVGNALTHKLGPLPVWAWALGIVGAAGVVYLFFLKPAGSASPVSSLAGGGTPPTGGLGGGGGGGGGNPSAPPSTPAASLTNFQWLNKVASQVAQATGLPLAQVQLYLNEYLNGQGPQGSTTATSLWQKVVDSALGLGGQPPAPVSQPNSSNYFGSNQNWLTSILEFLPSGTPGSVQTELTNLVNGTTTTISQAAADALNASQGIVGAAPQVLSYQIGSPTAPSSPPAPWQITYQQEVSWVQSFIANTRDFTSWIAEAPSGFASAFNPQQQQAIYNYFTNNKTSWDQAVNLINFWAKNPSQVPAS